MKVVLCWFVSCPHLLHCHRVCCVDVTTTPPTPTPLWEHLTPLIPRHGHTQSTGWQPIKTPAPYANDTQHWLTNVVNCHFPGLWIKNTDTLTKFLFICSSLLQLAAWLQIKMQLDKQHETKVSVTAWGTIVISYISCPSHSSTLTSLGPKRGNHSTKSATKPECILLEAIRYFITAPALFYST